MFEFMYVYSIICLYIVIGSVFIVAAMALYYAFTGKNLLLELEKWLFQL